MGQKEGRDVLLVQRERRVSIPRARCKEEKIEIGDYVSLSIRKATDKEMLEALKRHG